VVPSKPFSAKTRRTALMIAARRSSLLSFLTAVAVLDFIASPIRWSDRCLVSACSLIGLANGILKKLAPRVPILPQRLHAA
jgi:hypothetical protein